MPFLPSDIFIHHVRDAKKLPAAAWKILQDHPRAANVILPQALKAKEASGSIASSDDLWIICSTESEIEFILSVTDGPLGPYPIFIFTPLPSDRLVDSYIRPCIQGLVTTLAANVPTSRVYSIFSPEPVTSIFAEEWTQHTGVGLADDHRYYAAIISYCTIKTLRRPSVDEFRGYLLRPAVYGDIKEIGELCYRFAGTSEPYTLTEGRAQQEAIDLVDKKQVWVHEAQGTKEIASIVAFTRNSDRVAAITKVCTKEKWLFKGYASRLVRKVCEHLLTGPNCKESVVLYVETNKTRVYDCAGFVGLAKDSQKVQGVDSWLEIGFDREKVDLGHW